MGEVELNKNNLEIHSHLITYGNASNPSLTEGMREEIETMWNEPAGHCLIDNRSYQVIFRITASYEPLLAEIQIYQNLDPRNNYFRIEEFAMGNISFVDGLGCNSGYFKLENLYKGSTTAAHEYGHTIGLDHPDDLDIRGKGVPGIMYPRGTLVDAQYQYEPGKPSGSKGGTMYPIFRRVHQEDIDDLKLIRLVFRENKIILGAFTNVWHPDHASLNTPGWG